MTFSSLTTTSLKQSATAENNKTRQARGEIQLADSLQTKALGQAIVVSAWPILGTRNMKERREKENKGAVVVSRAPASLLTSASMDASDVFGAAGVAQGTQLMLSPPPEEELRTQASPARRAVRS